MPRQHTHTVYTYEELTPEAQENAREWWLQTVLTNDAQFYLWDPVDDMLKEEVKNYGYESVEWGTDTYSNVKVEVTGAVDKAVVFPRAGITFVEPADVEVWVAPPSRDYGRSTPEVIVELQFDEEDLAPDEGSIEELEDRIHEAIEEDLEGVQYKLQDLARDEIEYAQSDDVIADNIIANEYEFYEDGRFFY